MTVPAGPGEISPLKRAFIALEEMKAKLEAAQRTRTEPIAIVGIGCRFPGAADPDAYWSLLSEGRSAVREIDRWDVARYFDPDPTVRGKMYTRWAGLLDSVDRFEPQFFGIAPREAVYIDPQHRLLLEVCWEALEHAGQAPDRLHGSPTGVFVGMCTSDYSTLQNKWNDLERIDAYSQSGLSFSIASGRISYVLGLQGPAMTVDTACSASLVATHLACQSLRLGECRLALAAGVHVILLPDNSVGFSKARMLSPDGRCKTFDASADGFVEGEGCGVIVLKRLSDALADRDSVLAVIRGSAVNQDGPSGGLTVPNGPSQEAVIRDALARGGISPSRVGYIEAHGTGTSLGDPIEVRALGAVLREGRSESDPVAIGSVKTNIGHLQGASGVAGLIKLVLALQHRQIPPHLHFTTPSPHIPWMELPVRVPTSLTPWTSNGEPRVGGVSAFGFSGTNAHVVVEEFVAREGSAAPAERPSHVLTLSARTESALRGLAAAWAEAIASAGDRGLADACFTANTGRAHLPCRAAMTVGSADQAAESLRALAAGESPRELARGHLTSSDRPRIAFLFTGQGSQAAGMGRQLYETQPTFRAAIDRCDAALGAMLPRRLVDVLHAPASDGAIDQTRYTQPALFALEYALAELWRSWGVVPTAVMGHSLGEYVAATVAGVFPVEQAIALVAARARLMDALPAGGAMAAVLADEATVRSAIASTRVAVAAVNGPKNIVISGDGGEVGAIVKRLHAQGIAAERLTVSHAFHSALMDPMLDEFERAVAAATPSQPGLTLVSNLTGQPARRELTEAAYWRRHLREPVLFAAGVSSLVKQGYQLFVEIGPRPVLSGMARRMDGADDCLWLPSLRPGHDDWATLLGTLATLHVRGARIDWEGFDRDYSRRRHAMPTYPFERARYWVTEPAGAESRRAGPRQEHPLLGPAIETAMGPVVFESTIDTAALPYLADHQKHGATIFPATAYLELGHAAARALFGDGTHAFEDLAITEPLALDPAATLDIQVVATPGTDDTASFRLFSRPAGGSGWIEHATGTMRRRATTAPPLGETPDAVTARCATEIPVADYYARMRDDGHEYGTSFQGIDRLRRTAGEAIGRVALRETESATAGRYRLHPALLDAAIQVLGAALPETAGEGGRKTYLPVSLERLTVFVPGALAGWSHVRVRQVEPATDTLAGDIRLFDDDGRTIAELEGMYMKPASRDALAGNAHTQAWLHEIAWVPLPATSPGTNAAAGVARPWLVFADRAGTAAGLVTDLHAAGARCVVVDAGSGFTRDGENLQVDPASRDELRRLFREFVPPGSVAGIAYCWSLDAEPPGDAAQPPTVGSRGGCGWLLHVVQALIEEHESDRPRLWVITRGAQPAGGAAAAVEQAATLGLARSITAEHPDLRCTCIDLAPGESAGDSATIAAELHADDREELIAFRGGTRLVARLRKRAPASPAPPFDGPAALEITTRGALDNLVLQQMERRAPGPGEVELHVDAVGLNFRDVLNALGMYEGGGPLGSECVGTVVALGEGVTRFEIGQQVMGMAAGALRDYVSVAAEGLTSVPAGMPATAAATVPIVFLTAIYSLETVAGLRAGERVLIHAGAGGVGLAAIQVAQALGAEVYATAGSEEKRAYLRSLGVRHVFHSRTLTFADEVLAATGGTGVDVVLNSLTGEFIPASVRALAQGGRFVELGKVGIWSPGAMDEARPDVAYTVVYLGDLPAATLQQLWARVHAGLADQTLRPLPERVYALADAPAAFRYMAQAKHIGKLVVTLEPARPVVREDGTYLVTGAFGGLGSQVARWLVSQGARSLALVGRRGAASPRGAALVAELEGAGATVQAAAVDVSDAAAMSALVRGLDGPPLRGVIHAAGVLDDGVLAQQTWARCDTVFRPKVGGAWALDRATAGLSLDWFVLFSSMVTVVGAPGQGNYAAANAALDALAHQRRARGQPGLSINWGPWADAGMSAGVSDLDRQRWQRQGISFIKGPQGLGLMGQLLADRRTDAAQIAALPVQWPVLLRQFPAGAEPLLFAELARQVGPVAGRPAAATTGPSLVDQLQQAAPVKRRAIAVTKVSDLARRVLGLEPSTPIDVGRPLQEFGLDSLMAVELRNTLGSALSRTLPATLLFKYPSVQALADFTLESLKLDDAPIGEAVIAAADAPDVIEVGTLSDDEVKRMLAEELASLSGVDWPNP